MTALLAMGALPSAAQTIWYDSQGFEDPPFQIGELAGGDMFSGQDGWLVTDDYGNFDLSSITVESDFVHDGNQAVMFDAASVGYLYSAWLRRNEMVYSDENNHVIDISIDIYIEDSDTRSEVWGVQCQSWVTANLFKWLVWDDNSLKMLSPDESQWLDTGFTFERNTWYNVNTSIDFYTWSVELFVDGESVFTTDVIDQNWEQFAFAAIYLGNPGNDKLYFDNFSVSSPNVTAIDHDPELPQAVSLTQNYPNPFNAQTNISFSLSEQSDIKIEVFDLLGRSVAVLADGSMPAGEHNVMWDATNQASGVYFYTIKAGDFAKTKKMQLLK